MKKQKTVEQWLKTLPEPKPKKPTEKKKESSTYLVAQYLTKNAKNYIHDMKRVCKANNIP